MSSKSEQLLPLCYEIEGLICLINQRNSDVPEGVYQMIKDKIKMLADEVDSLAPVKAPEIEPAPVAEDIPLSETMPDVEPEMSTADEEAVADSALLEEEEDADVAPQPEEEPAQEIEKPKNNSLDLPVISKFQVNYFSINDRYRFSRELFNGDMAEMEETLDAISGLSSAEEVVDYLANDLCWDPDSETVKDFVAIVLSKKQ